jgi:hypothetical protein
MLNYVKNDELLAQKVGLVVGVVLGVLCGMFVSAKAEPEELEYIELEVDDATPETD